MTLLPATFDSNEYDDMTDFEPIPPGQYPMQIIATKKCATKDRTGTYIKLEFVIIQGEFKGRKIWTNLNLENISEQCTKFARKALATICRACKKPAAKDSDELIGIPLLVNLKIIPAKGDYAASNAPTGYKPMAGMIAPNDDPTAVASTAGSQVSNGQLAGTNSALSQVPEQDESDGWDDGIPF